MAKRAYSLAAGQVAVTRDNKLITVSIVDLTKEELKDYVQDQTKNNLEIWVIYLVTWIKGDIK